MIIALSSLNLEKCYPKDSDVCLGASGADWSNTKCSTPNIQNGEWCLTFGKNVRRCCPETCRTGTFTEADCNSFPGNGDCIYPNDAQCSESGL